jgi:SdpI/YfhL protein family
VSALLGVVLLVAGAGLLTIGLLGWWRRLPRNRFAGVRTPATLRSEVAFVVANRVAAPPVLGAGAICTAGGAVSLGTSGLTLTLIASMAGVSAFALVLAGGLLGHRVAAAVPARTGGCGDCTCRGEGCSTTRDDWCTATEGSLASCDHDA